MVRSRRRLFALLVGFACIAAASWPASASPYPQPSPDQPPAHAAELAAQQTDAVLARIADRFPSFGGSYIDREGTLRVWITEGDAERAREVIPALDSVHDEDLASLPMAHIKGSFSFGQLKQWHDSIRANMHQAVEGLVYTGYDQMHNRLSIGVRNLSERRAAIEQELTRLGIPLEAVHLEQSEPVMPASSLETNHRPLVGGLKISYRAPWGTDTGACTFGFNASRDGTPGFVTNSHCSVKKFEKDGTIYGQPSVTGNDIGNEAVDPDLFIGGICASGLRCRYSDANFSTKISTVDGVRRIARMPVSDWTTWNGTSTFRVVKKATGHPSVGVYVEKVGAATGRTQADVIDNCRDSQWGDTDIWLMCQVKVENWPGDPKPFLANGDSGSAAFHIEYAPEWNDVKLMGIFWGSSGTTDGTYSKMYQIEQEIGALNVCISGFSC